MKKFLFSMFMLAGLSASAQEFKPFKVNVSVGYAKPFTSAASGGVLIAIEPKYGLSDHFDLGLRLESAFVARGVVTNGQTVTGDVGAFGSYMLTGTYLFGTGGIRPFLGIGAGAYSIGGAGTVVISQNGQPNQDITFVSDTKFGGLVRAGIKAGHFVAAVEYNAAPTTSNRLANTTINSENAYLGVKVGFDIGGGRK
ncbi:hypothetical protein ACFSUS_02530 [Spirosoma soli]|uniref:Outer membrane beta-barrel protein n=1 Tax=Spirosoma soli TaxID=1770529 RepID=A0ABW5LZK8_9BACT